MAQSVVGTWRVVRAIAHDGQGNRLPDPYSARLDGRLILTADGIMMSVLCDHADDLPPGAARFYSSYCGRYTVTGDRLVTKVHAASDPARVGGEQPRGVRFEGETMVLMPPPALVGGVMQHREIFWERISPV